MPAPCVLQLRLQKLTKRHSVSQGWFPLVPLDLLIAHCGGSIRAFLIAKSTSPRGPRWPPFDVAEGATSFPLVRACPCAWSAVAAFTFVRSSSSKATGTISTSWSASWIHPFQPLNKFLGNDQHEPRMAGCGYVSLHCPKCKNIHCYLPHVAGREWTNSHKNTPRRSLGRCFSFSQARRRPAWFLARQRKDLGQPRSPSTPRAPNRDALSPIG